MPEISRVKDKYYIVATSSVIDPQRLVIKDGDTFGVFDRFGDILPFGKGEQGLYHEGTRFLSRYELRINGKRPFLLSSNVSEDNVFLTADLTNPDMYSGPKIEIKRDTIHIMRSRLLLSGSCIEHIRMKNFGKETTEFTLQAYFDSDFADVFEVRGMKRAKRGRIEEPVLKKDEFILSYTGLDNLERTTLLKFSRPPRRTRPRHTLAFQMKLGPDQEEYLSFTISCIIGPRRGRLEPADYDEASKKVKEKMFECKELCADIYTSNEQFNESVQRSVADLEMMLTETAYGLYPYGGIPWYTTPFGRDGTITALECLWMNPRIAEGVLNFQAAYQARDFDKSKAAEPGKIFHEMRKGEMADMGEIPFGLYYGSVDSTPLFVMLAGAYWKRTGNTDYIKKIWNNIEMALLWMENYGDVDGDGFLEYVPQKEGLINQGWKDSADSVFHADGSFPEGPIALCEVQGYAYAARIAGAELAILTGKKNYSEKLLKEAYDLKKKFNQVFWDETLGTYVLALDGDKKPCRVVASNAGHTLFTGIAFPNRAAKVSEKLLSQQSFSGWGIRTLAANEVLYNPISYHNGSVWPHDNALIAWGFSRYGLREPFLKIFSGIFDASLFMQYSRLPELFCGFHKRPGQSPTQYPVACAPQAWASGSLIFMLQACLGLEFEPGEEKLVLRNPFLPEFLEQVRLKNLYVTAEKSVDLQIARHEQGVTVEILRKPHGITVLTIK